MTYYEFRYVKRGNKKVLQARVGAITVEKTSWWKFWDIGKIEMTWIGWQDIPTIAEIKDEKKASLK